MLSAWEFSNLAYLPMMYLQVHIHQLAGVRETSPAIAPARESQGAEPVSSIEEAAKRQFKLLTLGSTACQLGCASNRIFQFPALFKIDMRNTNGQHQAHINAHTRRAVRVAACQGGSGGGNGLTAW